MELSERMLAAGWEDQCGVDVASDGEDYFAVWADARSGQFAMYGGRLSGEGDLLDPSGLMLVEPDGGVETCVDTAARVVWTGASWLAIWKGGQSLTLLEIDRDGEVLRRSEVPFGGFSPALATNGTTHIVAWRATYPPEVRYAVVNAALELLDEQGLDGSEGALDHAIVSDGTNFLLAWSSYARAQIQVALLDANGAVRQRDSKPASAGRIAATATSRGFLVAWDSPYGTVTVGRVTASGSVTGDPVTIEPAPVGRPVLAWDGASALLVWAKPLGERIELQAMHFTAEGERQSAPFTVSDSFGIRHAGSAASNGRNVLVAFNDQRMGANVFFALVPAGSVEPEPERVLAVTSRGNALPAAARNAAGTVVAWAEGIDPFNMAILARRFDRLGRPLDTTPILIARAFGGPVTDLEIAAADPGFLVAWVVQKIGEFPSLRAARLTNDGVVLDQEPLEIAGTLEFSTDSAIGSDGQDFLAVWVPRNADPAIRLIRWENGSLLEPRPLSGAVSFSLFSIIFADDRYVVVHERIVPCGSRCFPRPDLWATEVSREGSIEGERFLRHFDSALSMRGAVQQRTVFIAVAGLSEAEALLIDSTTLEVLREVSLGPVEMAWSDPLPHVAVAPAPWGWIALWDSVTANKTSTYVLLDRDGMVLSRDTLEPPGETWQQEAISGSAGEVALAYVRGDNDGVPRAFVRFSTTRSRPVSRH